MMCKKIAFGPNVYGYVSKGNLEEELVEKVKEVIEVIKCDYYVTFKVNGIDINIREIGRASCRERVSLHV